MIENWKMKRSEKYFEDGQYLGYYYQLVKLRIFWEASFTIDRKLKYNIKIKSFTKSGARQKFFKKLADFHFSRLEIRKNTLVDYEEI
jgi:hypothetical protein